jgi:hypothetical protein
MKRFFGNSDHKTSESYYSSDQEYHYAELAGVREELEKLVATGEAQFLYVDDESDRRVVAFRFTSDAAHDAHYGKVLSRGLSLGRGGWDPFGDLHQYWEFFGCRCCGTRTEHGYNDIEGNDCPVQKAKRERALAAK